MKIIITESQFIKLGLRRRLDELPKHIKNAYDWLNPKAFGTFDEFMNRVIINATGLYIKDNMYEPNHDLYQDSRITVEPIVRNLVTDKYYEELLDYYNS